MCRNTAQRCKVCTRPAGWGWPRGCRWQIVLFESVTRIKLKETVNDTSNYYDKLLLKKTIKQEKDICWRYNSESTAKYKMTAPTSRAGLAAGLGSLVLVRPRGPVDLLVAALQTVCIYIFLCGFFFGIKAFYLHFQLPVFIKAWVVWKTNKEWM